MPGEILTLGAGAEVEAEAEAEARMGTSPGLEGNPRDRSIARLLPPSEFGLEGAEFTAGPFFRGGPSTTLTIDGLPPGSLSGLVDGLNHLASQSDTRVGWDTLNTSLLGIAGGSSTKALSRRDFLKLSLTSTAALGGLGSLAALITRGQPLEDLQAIFEAIAAIPRKSISGFSDFYAKKKPYITYRGPVYVHPNQTPQGGGELTLTTSPSWTPTTRPSRTPYPSPTPRPTRTPVPDSNNHRDSNSDRSAEFYLEY